MRRLLVVLVSGLAALAGCGDDTADLVAELQSTCEDECEARHGGECAANASIGECQTACRGLPPGDCAAEQIAEFRCLADGGYSCQAVDQDGDGMNDGFTRVPNADCTEEERRHLTCESCALFCNTSGDESCGGDDCISSCESRSQEVTETILACGAGYNDFLFCSGAVGVTCDAGVLKPPADCSPAAFLVASCMPSDGSNFLCERYCFVAEAYHCGATGCRAACEAAEADADCGPDWHALLDCIETTGEATCEGDVLVATDGTDCDGERSAYETCAGI